MGLLDGKLTAVAALVDLFGGTVVLRRVNEGVEDAAEGFQSLEPFGSPHTCKGLWSGYLAGIASLDLASDGIVQPGDRRVFIKAAGLPFHPKAGDVMEFPNLEDSTKPNNQFLIINVDPIVTGDEVLLFDCQVRAG